jgi:hypothetical protein
MVREANLPPDYVKKKHPHKSKHYGCKYAGCVDDRHYSGGYCRKHYQKLMRHGTPDGSPRVAGVCSVENCERKSHSKGMCKPHYDESRRKQRVHVS